MKPASISAAFLMLGAAQSPIAWAQEDPVPSAQAEAYWDAGELKASRDALDAEHGGGTTLFLLADRFEYQSGDGADELIFEGQGRWGTDENRLAIKTSLGYSLDAGALEEAEVQALWSKPVSAFFDVQAGIRHDFEPGPSRSYAVVGVQGLAPYWFEVDSALFLSEEGDLSARFEAEYDFRLTQRLILQPSTEVDVSFSDVPELETGSGLTQVEAGLRLRYEIDRQFAPYAGVSWTSAFGDTADIKRSLGEDTEALSFVAGVRVWF